MVTIFNSNKQAASELSRKMRIGIFQDGGKNKEDESNSTPRLSSPIGKLRRERSLITASSKQTTIIKLIR